MAARAGVFTIGWRAKNLGPKTNLCYQFGERIVRSCDFFFFCLNCEKKECSFFVFCFVEEKERTKFILVQKLCEKNLAIDQ